MRAQVPCGAAGHYLLGRICVLSNRHDSAVAHLCDALRADPLLWCAYEELCALGARVPSLAPYRAACGPALLGLPRVSGCWPSLTVRGMAGLPCRLSGLQVFPARV